MNDPKQQYLVQFSHPIHGNVMLGALSAESTEDAQLQAIELLKEHGMPEGSIAHDVTTHSSILLQDGVVVTVAPAHKLAHRDHTVPMFIAQ